MNAKPAITIVVDGKVEDFTCTDVPHLQYLAKTNWELFVRATERLRKARLRRTDAEVLLRQTLTVDWGGEYGPQAARLLRLIEDFLHKGGVSEQMCGCPGRQNNPTINHDPNYKCTTCGKMVPTL